MISSFVLYFNNTYEEKEKEIFLDHMTEQFKGLVECGSFEITPRIIDNPGKLVICFDDKQTDLVMRCLAQILTS